MKDRLLAMRPLLLRAIGYPAFFLLFFVVFLYVTFPYDRLKEVIIAQAEAPRVSPLGQTTPSGMELTIGSLGPTFFPVLVPWLPLPIGNPSHCELSESQGVPGTPRESLALQKRNEWKGFHYNLPPAPPLWRQYVPFRGDGGGRGAGP